MSDSTKSPIKPAAAYRVARGFKYPSEDECLVRRLGSGVLAAWGELPPDLQARVLAEAVNAWDREYGVAQLPQKLETFIRRHPSRVAQNFR